MGGILSTPVTDKHSHQLEDKRFRVGASGMQGYVSWGCMLSKFSKK